MSNPVFPSPGDRPVSHPVARPIARPSRLIANLAAGLSQTIVCYGTSLTADVAWPDQFQAELDRRFPGLATVVNSGLGGRWSGWGRDNLGERVLAKRPDAVLIEFGINDAFLDYATSVAKAQANLEDMIVRISRLFPACEIILMTMNPPIDEAKAKRAPIEPYYQMYRDVAKVRNLLLVDHHVRWQRLLDADPVGYRRLFPDGRHPNAEGCTRVIIPTLLAALGLAAPGLMQAAHRSR